MLRLENITKKVGTDEYLLHGINLTFERGSITGVISLDQNETTTLLKALSNNESLTAGKILLDGKAFKKKTLSGFSKKVAFSFGQETLFPNLSLLDNLYFGNNRGSFCSFIGKMQQKKQASPLLQQFGITPKWNRKVNDFSHNEKSLLSIIRLFLLDKEYYLMDRITENIGLDHYNTFKTLCLQLKERGKGIVLVPNYPDQVFDLCDQVIVLRNGKVAFYSEVSKTNIFEIRNIMNNTQYTVNQAITNNFNIFEKEVLQYETLVEKSLKLIENFCAFESVFCCYYDDSGESQIQFSNEFDKHNRKYVLAEYVDFLKQAKEWNHPCFTTQLHGKTITVFKVEQNNKLYALLGILDFKVEFEKTLQKIGKEYANCFFHIEQEIAKRNQLIKLNRELSEHRDQLEEYNRTLEQKVEERAMQLHEKTKSIRTMLENIQQGIFNLLPGNIIDCEYSNHLSDILKTEEIAGKNVMDLVFANSDLSEDILNQIETSLACIIGEDSMMFGFNSHILVRQLKKTFSSNDRIWELDWIPICNDHDIIEKLMVVIRDVTEIRKLELEAEKNREMMEIVEQIINVSQEKFFDFLNSSENFLEECETLLEREQDQTLSPTAINQLCRNLHTIKGNARTLGFLHLTQTLHEVEKVFIQVKQKKQWSIKSLMEELKTVRESFQNHVIIAEEKVGRSRSLSTLKNQSQPLFDRSVANRFLTMITTIETEDKLPEESREIMEEMKKSLQIQLQEASPLKEVLSGIIDSLPSLANEINKEPPKVNIKDHGIFLTKPAHEFLRNSFTHLFRNSMDHGIEATEKRLARGKTKNGNIILEMTQKQGNLLLHYQDDGAGLNLKRIRQKAIEQNLLSSHETISPETLANYIFAPGFSTAKKVSTISGRGVGMDAVKNIIEENGGSITITVQNQNESPSHSLPFSFQVELPEHFAVSSHV